MFLHYKQLNCLTFLARWQSQVYCNGLENRRSRKRPVGSNPTFAAISWDNCQRGQGAGLQNVYLWMP